MTSTIIFRTSQNNVWSVYIFGIFFQFVVYFYYGYVALPKWLQSNFKVVNTCEVKKRRQIVPVLKEYVEESDIKTSRLVLSVLAWCEKEAY